MKGSLRLAGIDELRAVHDVAAEKGEIVRLGFVGVAIVDGDHAVEIAHHRHRRSRSHWLPTITASPPTATSPPATAAVEQFRAGRARRRRSLLRGQAEQAHGQQEAGRQDQRPFVKVVEQHRRDQADEHSAQRSARRQSSNRTTSAAGRRA